MQSVLHFNFKMILFHFSLVALYLSAEAVSDKPFNDTEFQSLENGIKNIGQRVVAIEPKGLESILNFEGPLEHYDKNLTTLKNSSLLSWFTDYLIRFDLSNNSSNNVAQQTAEYNKKHFTNESSNFIKLWISFIPKGDIEEDLDAVLNVVRKANEIYPGTVSTLVLNYGFLLLDRESVPVVIYDIQKFSTKVRSLKDMNLVLGVGLDILNCQNRKEFIEMLDLAWINVFLLLPHERRKNAYTSIANLKISAALTLFPCASILQKYELKNGSLLPIDTFITLDVNLQEGFYNFDVRGLAELVDFFDFNTSTPLIFHGVVDNVNMEKSSKYISKSSGFHHWIQLPIKFSNLHFGGVISLKHLPSNWTRFIPTLLHTFRNIVIEDHVHGQKSHDFVLDLIKYNMATQNKSRHHNYDFSYYSSRNFPLKISLIVTLNSNLFSVYKQQVDNAISVAAAGNKVSPGSVDAMYLYRTSYGRSSDYSGLSEDCMALEMNINFHLIVYYTKLNMGTKKLQKDNLSTFSVGRVVYENICVAAECNENSLSNNTEAETIIAESIANAIMHEHELLDFVDQIDVFDEKLFPLKFICKSVIHNTNILEIGAEKIATFIIKELNSCETCSNVWNATVLHYVNIMGCDNDSNSNITQLAEYVLTLEILSTWAVAANKTLFVNAGMENAAQCKEPSQLKDCHCEWWIRTQGNNDGLFMDKKSVALQLYENLNAKIDVISKSTQWRQTMFLILLPSFLLTAFITALTVYLVLHYRAKDIISKQEVADFINGSKKPACENNHGDIDGQDEAQSAAFSRQKYEISSNKFTIDKSRCLGSGEFGKIFFATIKLNDETIEVAVKIANSQGDMKNHGYYLAVKGLISEIKILAFVGSHRHIISLMGAYTENLRKGKLAVFLELCPLGSLDKYLRAYKPQETNMNSEHVHIPESSNRIDSTEVEMETIGLNTEMSNDLYRWAGEVACAMEFLSSKKLVHADLAARNVLLAADKTAKICDFGLSRRLYDYTEYVKQNQAPLPWRWMPPESLRRLVFNEKSDVWAYGVTLWELFTLGDEPYPGLSWTVDFPMVLNSGIRLPAPRYNVKQIYSIMVRCWNNNPSNRPTFSELKSELKI